MSITTNLNNDKVKEIAQAIYTINRHAKTAPNPKYLYALKKNALNKLISDKEAEKVGIQLSPNPKFSKQQLDVLVKVANYYFHIPPIKGDTQNLPHLGKQSVSYQNPKVRMPLKKATTILENYAGKPSQSLKKTNNRQLQQRAFSKEHLFLGK